MKKLHFLHFLLFLLALAACRSTQPLSTDLHLLQTFHIQSTGGWDYLALDPSGRLFVSHGTQVNVLDGRTGDSLAVVPNTLGVHGICFAHGKGFTSNGRTNDVTVFDLKTCRETGRFPVGKNPDFIQFEPFSKKIITCNGGSQDLTLLDPATGKITVTIPVGGKPETAMPDDKGLLFVNIEDKNEVVQVNLRTNAVEQRWSLAPAEAPTGLAFDRKTQRLFVGCDDFLVVLNAQTGAVVARIPIGAGCDGVVFDPETRLIFTSNGEAGTVSRILERDADHFEKLPDIASKTSARTLTLDPKTHRIFLPAAERLPLAPGETGRPKMKPGSFQILVLGQR